MQYKNEKGITLIVVALTIVIATLLIVGVSTGISNISETNQYYMVKEDIIELNKAAQTYYMENDGLLPIKENTPTDDAFYNELISPEASEDLDRNPNDNTNYYEIDITKLNDLKLNKPENTYLINERSLTVYCREGFLVDGKKHYTASEKFSGGQFASEYYIKLDQIYRLAMTSNHTENNQLIKNKATVNDTLTLKIYKLTEETTNFTAINIGGKYNSATGTITGGYNANVSSINSRTDKIIEIPYQLTVDDNYSYTDKAVIPVTIIYTDSNEQVVVTQSGLESKVIYHFESYIKNATFTSSNEDNKTAEIGDTVTLSITRTSRYTLTDDLKILGHSVPITWNGTTGTATYKIQSSDGAPYHYDKTNKKVVYDGAGLKDRDTIEFSYKALYNGNQKESINQNTYSNNIIRYELWISIAVAKEYLQLGDYVNYDAGKWTSSEISYMANLNQKNTGSSDIPYVPSSDYQFGGVAVGQDKNSTNPRMLAEDTSDPHSDAGLASTNTMSYGWRIFDIDSTNNKITLISSGDPELYSVGRETDSDNFKPAYTSAKGNYVLNGQINPILYTQGPNVGKSYTFIERERVTALGSWSQTSSKTKTATNGTPYTSYAAAKSALESTMQIRDYSMYVNDMATRARGMTTADFDSITSKIPKNEFTEKGRIYSNTGYTANFNTPLYSLIDNNSTYWIGQYQDVTNPNIIFSQMRRSRTWTSGLKKHSTVSTEYYYNSKWNSGLFGLFYEYPQKSYYRGYYIDYFTSRDGEYQNNYYLDDKHVCGVRILIELDPSVRFSLESIGNKTVTMFERHEAPSYTHTFKEYAIKK